MILDFVDDSGATVKMIPRIDTCQVKGFGGQKALSFVLALEAADDADFEDMYIPITMPFDEFISIKNSAYVDVDGFPPVRQLLEKGIAKETRFSRSDDFAVYPLWVFDEKFLSEAGGEKYKEYAQFHDAYTAQLRDTFHSGDAN